MKPTISVAAVSERDIDLLLLEEFAANSEFRDWFVSCLRGTSDLVVHSLVEARRSVTQSLGESDLEITLRRGRKRIRLLVENKIGASFQARQAKRYAERASMYTRRGECEECITVLVAPKNYLGESDASRGFDSSISYERILEWLLKSPALGHRTHYKASLLAAAITKATYGYQPEADRPVTDFWQGYWQLLCDRAPELEMARPDRKPARAGFVWLYPTDLPGATERYVSIVHKFPHGKVDLQFAALGPKTATVQRLVRTQLPDGATVERAAKSAALRLNVAPLNTGLPFASQETAALEGVLAAKQWLSWALAHSTLVSRILALAR